MGHKVGDDMPDVGISANRYRLELVGNTQTLPLTSWDALPRMDKTIAYPWQPKSWYSLKLRVDVKGDKATIRGKVWERGKEEPKDWTVEFEDPTPNKESAPALYGYASGILEGQIGAESFFDNVKILPNKAADTKTDTKPETKPTTKPDTKPEAKPDTKPGTKPDDKPRTTPGRRSLSRRWSNTTIIRRPPLFVRRAASACSGACFAASVSPLAA